MSLSDCVKCWETPCSCGYEWKTKSTEYICEFIKMLQNELERRNVNKVGE